ncbi:MAG: hypothetical protein LBC65_04390 [Oscillospiraceae bacterium]|nr:hypothetical protein [Oscillospiraceae bacterium]
MACFLVPTTEAIITTIARKVLCKPDADSVSVDGAKIPFTRKLKWLNNMLWGGSALLAFEHVWHGEVTPWFPFLTNAANPEDAAEMLHEMATSGVAMAVLTTVVWLGVVAVTSAMERRERLSPHIPE